MQDWKFWKLIARKCTYDKIETQAHTARLSVCFSLLRFTDSAPALRKRFETFKRQIFALASVLLEFIYSAVKTVGATEKITIENVQFQLSLYISIEMTVSESRRAAIGRGLW